MLDLDIRPARQQDLEVMLRIDHSVSSLYAYQMELSQDTHNIAVTFRSIRLPRAATIKYPRDENAIMHSWESTCGILVGWYEGQVVAYANLEEIKSTQTIRVKDFVVSPEKRRSGIANRLLSSCEEWGVKHQKTMISLEIPPRNNPAVSLAHKLGYHFCGYHDQYFPNGDMALFFIKQIY